jgi:transcriptional/translational regulatory protein YebC/TACO1
LQRYPNITKELDDAQREDVERLIEKLEDDDDIQKVFHTAN